MGPGRATSAVNCTRWHNAACLRHCAPCTLRSKCDVYVDSSRQGSLSMRCTVGSETILATVQLHIRTAWSLWHTGIVNRHTLPSISAVLSL
jgi:hypothetical protein